MVDNKYGLEPEEWADLKTNYPEYYKNIVIENRQSGGGGSTIKAIPYVIYDSVEPMGGGFVKSVNYDPESHDKTYELYTFAEMKQIFDDGSSNIFAYSLTDIDGGMTGRIHISTYIEEGERKEMVVLNDVIFYPPSTTDPTGYMSSTELILKSDDTVDVQYHAWAFTVTNDD